ncbi:hypothetical protein [Sphingopyxis sp. SCN 67-31]|uniref:hypothetical protein n=1 Tax=Sphingopyxis sp. SCN 67-31 TaxID=1660142 RepID=UPI00086B1F51|nr:hypothetical protein [Sphingopyxis sp. SCN 67-31]ODU28997.1 MAG: hypothetical protein ABS88_10730 [Sphingopyxis sp. SCN 67-31]
MANKKDDAGNPASDADAAGVPVLTREDVQAMIDAALAKQGAANANAYDEFVAKMPETILGVVKDTDLFGDAIDEALAKIDFRALADEAVLAALAPVDWNEKIEDALASRDARLAEQAAADAKAASDAAAADQRKAASDQKKAAKAVEDATLAAEKKRMAQADRARREYASIVAAPIATALDIGSASSIELRLADGATFMPGFEIGGIEAKQLPDESGRAVLDVALSVARDAVGFTASEAILIIEGGSAGDPLTVYRAELMPPVRVGGGTLAEFPAGSFAFRRLSPLPEAVAA